MKQILLIAIPMVVAIALTTGFFLYKRNNTCCQSNSNTKVESSLLCNSCGRNSCDRECASSQEPNAKTILPSCSLSEKDFKKRIEQLKTGILSKAITVTEIETGYQFTFGGSVAYSTELLEFINFERGCCSGFTYALIFEPGAKATHLQIYGTPAIKAEIHQALNSLGVAGKDSIH